MAPIAASRRQFLYVAGATLGLAPIVAWLASPTTANSAAAETFPVNKTDEEWRTLLTDDQYDVLRGHSTERAGTSPLNHEKRRGTFVCAGCGQPLFSSETKFESGTGWPSFYKPLENAVATSVDTSYFMVRTEVHCARCGGHLGHLFPDGPKPTGERYCMNGAAMKFNPENAS
jgi:peptide-methionine (R)-S-oxide reductase